MAGPELGVGCLPLLASSSEPYEATEWGYERERERRRGRRQGERTMIVSRLCDFGQVI